MAMPKVTSIQYCYAIGVALEAATLLHKQIEASADNDVLIPSYCAAVCSAIEGVVNTAVIDFFFHKFGAEYRRHSKPYLKMPVEDRFRNMVLVLSGFRYQLNERHDDIVAVFRLFEIRNRLLHAKEQWHLVHAVEAEGGRLHIADYVHDPVDDPYAKPLRQMASPAELAKYLVVARHILYAFDNFERKVNRRNYNPRDWLVLIKRT